MLVTLEGIVMDGSKPFRANIPTPITVNPLVSTIWVRKEQARNALVSLKSTYKTEIKDIKNYSNILKI